MRTLFVWLTSIITACLVVSVCAADLATSDAISATATVVQPLGLLEMQATADSLASPFLTQLASRWFLIVPGGNPILQLNGVPIDLEISRSGEVISLLDISAILESRSANSPMTLTIIYSEN